MKCRVCNSIALPFAVAEILGKYKVQYFQCNTCQFLQTEQPYWLAEAYDNAISFSDIGLVQRNIVLSKKVKSVITLLYDTNGRFLDYGGGYGLLVRLMRDAGFNFFRYDPYCENLFAKAFEAGKESSYEMLVAFEVFEHLVDPLAEVEQMVKRSPNILFSTEIVPVYTPQPNEWWYYGLEHGQHIALYKQKTLQFLAERFGLNLYSNGTNLHLFTRKKITPFLFRASISTKASRLLDILVNRPSLIQQDYQQALASVKSEQP